jgi:hypothetical protein
MSKDFALDNMPEKADAAKLSLLMGLSGSIHGACAGSE